MKPKYARCIDTGDFPALTLNKIYEVESVGEKYAIHFPDKGELHYFKYRFENVGCPCQVKNCIAKHAL